MTFTCGKFPKEIYGELSNISIQIQWIYSFPPTHSFETFHFLLTLCHSLWFIFFFFHFSVAHIVELSGSARSTRTAKVKLEMAPKWCPLSNWCSWTYGNWLQPSVCKKLLPCYLLKKYKITFFLIDKKQKTRYCLRLSPNTNHILQCIRQFSLI